MSDGPPYIKTPVSVQRPEMPAQPKTRELPAMTDRALLEDLSKVVKAGFANLTADLSVVSNDLQVVKDRVVIIEKWKISTEERQTAHSGGFKTLAASAKTLSDSDLRQEAELANERTARIALANDVQGLKASLAQNTVMTAKGLELARSAARNPALQALFFAIVAFATAWLTRHT